MSARSTPWIVGTAALAVIGGWSASARSSSSSESVQAAALVEVERALADARRAESEARTELARRTQVAAAQPAATQPAGAKPPAAVLAPTAATPPDSVVAVPNEARIETGCTLIAQFVGAARAWCATPGDTAGAWPGVPPLRTMVVVLPDPLDSHLDWAFDSGVESVRRALERTGFVMDRFWLPWAVDVDSARARSGSSAGRTERLRRVRPGLMLFRLNAVDREELVLVYLVGETPTGGVHRAAFDAALADRRLVRDRFPEGEDPAYGACETPVWASPVPRFPWAAAWPGWPTAPALHLASRSPSQAGPPSGWARPAASQLASDRLRIVGPIFSGSMPSLRRALAAYLDADPTAAVDVVSGGATAPANDLVLTRGLPRVRYCATVNTVAELRRVITEMLADRLRISASRIAYLKESTTPFGQSLAAPGASGASGTSGTSGMFGTSGMSDAAVGGEGDVERPRKSIEISFPMNISRLRGAYARDAGRGASADTLMSPGAPRPSRIPLDLRDPASTTESPAVMSDLTAATIERTLHDIAQTLLAHKTRVVGIIATDVRDRLFLAHEVRTRLPDVQVFLVGSHSLYLRPELNDALRGTYVVSTYPLFLESQFWRTSRSTMSYGERLVFTTDLAEGTYNAVLAQAGVDSLMMDYAYPFDATGPSRPPVWITMIGRTTMVPLVARPSTDPRTVRAALPFGAHAIGVRAFDRYGWSLWESRLKLLLLCMVLAGGAMSTHWLAQRARAAPSPAVAREAPTSPMHARLAHEWSARGFELFCHRELWLLFRQIALLGAIVPLWLVLFEPRLHGQTIRAFVVYVVVVAALSALVLALYSFHKQLRAEKPRWREFQPWRTITRHLLVAMLALSYAALTLTLVVQACLLEPDSDARAFFTRALQVGSGLSPIVPLIIGGVGLFAWCTSHLRRVSLMSEVSSFEMWAIGSLKEEDDRDLLAITAESAQPHERRMTPREAFAKVSRTMRPALDLVERGPGPRSTTSSPVEEMRRSVRMVRANLLKLVPSVGALLPTVLVVLLVVWFAVVIGRTPETVVLPPLTSGKPYVPSAFDLLFFLTLIGSLLLTGWTLYRLVRIWRETHSCLEAIEATPIAAALGRLDRSVRPMAQMTPFNVPSSQRVNRILDREIHGRWRRLAATEPALTAELARRIFAPPAAAVVEPAAQETVAAATAAAHGDGPTTVTTTVTTSAAATATVTTTVTTAATAARPDGARPARTERVMDVLRVRSARCEFNDGVVAEFDAFYRMICGPDGAAGAECYVDRYRAEDTPAARSAVEEWRTIVEEVAALYVLDYVESVVRHLRYLAFYLVTALVISTTLISSYPFSPQSIVKGPFFLLLMGTVAGVVWVLAEMNRNTTLSRITDTDQGQVTWNARFIVNLLLVGALPVFTLVSSQFPAVRDFLFSWVSPLLRALSKG